MTTHSHDQRISALEQFQRETIEAVRESNLHIIALIGAIQSQGKDIKMLVEQGKEHSALLKQILDRLPAKE
jgi:hypothetical protein